MTPGRKYFLRQMEGNEFFPLTWKKMIECLDAIDERDKQIIVLRHERDEHKENALCHLSDLRTLEFDWLKYRQRAEEAEAEIAYHLDISPQCNERYLWEKKICN